MTWHDEKSSQTDSYASCENLCLFRLSSTTVRQCMMKQVVKRFLMPKGIYMDGDYCNVHRFKEAKFDPATGLSK